MKNITHILREQWRSKVYIGTYVTSFFDAGLEYQAIYSDFPDIETPITILNSISAEIRGNINQHNKNN